MNVIALRFALIIFGCSVLHFDSATAQGLTLDLSNYEPTFDENFDTLNVSPRGPGTRWIAHTPYNGDFGDATFVDPTPGFPFRVDNGVLRIEARKGTDGKWRSGLLASVDSRRHGFAQQYGYFEMRASLPAGDGVWPAFWLLGVERTTKQSEIDVMEFYGHAPSEYMTAIHVWDLQNAAQNRSASDRVAVAPGSLSDGFHTYGVSVDPDWIRFYFDRHEVAKQPAAPEFHQPLYILVDLALGGGWPIERAHDPSVLQVDYIRAWRKKE